MNKILKIFLIFLSNIAVAVLLWLFADLCMYSFHLIQQKNFSIDGFKNIYNSDMIYYKGFEDFYTGGFDDGKRGRLPDGLQYKKKPIVVFGCSYAFGQNCAVDKNFSGILSNLLKRPVYNRAMCGSSFQHMYYQTLTDSFYKDVPPADTVIYMAINYHYGRMLGDTFSLFDEFRYLHYTCKNGSLIEDNYNSFFNNVLMRSYFFRLIKYQADKVYVDIKLNSDKISDEALVYFLKTRENLEKKWGKNFNFVVYFYRVNHVSEKLIQKLEKNGFIVITNEELTKENLHFFPSKYMQNDGHPNEAAWELLTPLFVRELKNKKVI